MLSKGLYERAMEKWLYGCAKVRRSKQLRRTRCSVYCVVYFKGTYHVLTLAKDNKEVLCLNVTSVWPGNIFIRHTEFRRPRYVHSRHPIGFTGVPICRDRLVRRCTVHNIWSRRANYFWQTYQCPCTYKLVLQNHYSSYLVPMYYLRSNRPFFLSLCLSVSLCLSLFRSLSLTPCAFLVSVRYCSYSTRKLRYPTCATAVAVEVAVAESLQYVSWIRSRYDATAFRSTWVSRHGLRIREHVFVGLLALMNLIFSLVR